MKSKFSCLLVFMSHEWSYFRQIYLTRPYQKHIFYPFCYLQCFKNKQPVYGSQSVFLLRNHIACLLATKLRYSRNVLLSWCAWINNSQLTNIMWSRISKKLHYYAKMTISMIINMRQTTHRTVKVKTGWLSVVFYNLIHNERYIARKYHNND